MLCQSIPKLSKHLGAILALLVCVGREAEAELRHHEVITQITYGSKRQPENHNWKMYIHGVSQ